MNREGSIGDRGVDGWVEWRLGDDYTDSFVIACGTFLIFVCRTEDVGGSNAASFDGDEELAEETFVWSLDSYLEAIAVIADYLDHPAPDNVVEAAREVWFAHLQQEAAAHAL